MLPIILLLLNITFTTNFSIIGIMLSVGNNILKTNMMPIYKTI